MQYQQDSKIAILIVASAAFFFFLESILVNLFGTLSHDMMASFHINAYQLGKLSAAYLLANIILVFPAGLMLDRISIKKILVVAIAACSLTAWMFYTTHSAKLATFCMFVSGMGGTFCFLGTMKLASRWFTGKKLALATGFVITGAMAGGLVAQTPVALMADHYGWRSIFLILSIIEAFLCIWVACVLKDTPDDFHVEKIQGLAEFKKSVIYAFKTPTNWIGGIFTSALNLPVTVLGAIWGVPFLMQGHHFSRADASSINALIFIGMIFGPPCAGWLSDRVKSRVLPMYFGAIISLVIILFLIFSHTQTHFLYNFLFLSLGFFSSVQILGYTIIIEHSKSEYAGASLGLSAVIIMSGGTFMQPLFGKIMQWHWSGLKHQGAPVYNLHAYQDAMLILPIAFIIAVCLLFLYQKSRVGVYNTN